MVRFICFFMVIIHIGRQLPEEFDLLSLGFKKVEELDLSGAHVQNTWSWKQSSSTTRLKKHKVTPSGTNTCHMTPRTQVTWCEREAER